MSNYASFLEKFITLLVRSVQIFCGTYVAIALFNILIIGDEKSTDFGIEEVIGGTIILATATLLSWTVKGWLTNFES